MHRSSTPCSTGSQCRDRRPDLRPTLLSLLACLLIIGDGTSPANAQAPASWHDVAIPDAWRKLPTGELAPVNGYSWYRCAVKIPASWRESRLTIFVEAIDDARATYVNGVNIGATGTFPPRFRSGLGERGRYRVDTALVRFGQLNTIAIRVFQDDPRPNFNVAPPVLVNELEKQAIRLEGSWEYRPGDEAAWSQIPPERLADTSSSFEKIDVVSDIERYVARRKGDNDPLSPPDAERNFVTPDDLQMQLVLSEPDIAQPLFMSWDERGRLWVMEYRQYPHPAGLKMTSRDVFLRSVYDRVPPPPPNHFVGHDRISIHEDTDGDGVYDQHKVFLDGLNIATSFAHARGGVWVTNPPYLLFYPDRDGDDRPDGDPEVHLEGFGLEDSHSVINSIRMAADGWLYAAQGSTVTAMVKRPGSDDEPIRTMGQQIWRYHPEKKRFEVFAEGGGNTFGVEIDAKGRVYSGHNGGNTRGFHYVQGSYSRKGFGKHGSLSNPYAFGYFQQMKHHDVPRFTHNFVIYEANALPATYLGKMFGVEPLQGQVVMSSFESFESSFQTNDISRPVKTDDQWFRPVDIKVGPDGCIYVADMYEQRIDHSSHYAGRVDRSNGRIYRLKPTNLEASAHFDYGALSSKELVQLLHHPNKWHRQIAQRLLGDRKDSSLIPTLIEQIQSSRGQIALEQLWALYQSGGLTTEIAREMLGHQDAFVRAWTVRLICDDRQVPAGIAQALADLSFNEPYIEVRKQLASSAQRLPPRDALPIIRNLVKYDEDADDVHQPLLLWWALESQVGKQGHELIFNVLLSESEIWDRPLMRDHLLQRLMKRYALAGSRQELLAAARLLRMASGKETDELLLAGFEEAYKGRSMTGLPAELVREIADAGGGSNALRLRQGDLTAIEEAIEAITERRAEKTELLQFLQVFGELQRPEFIPLLLEVVTTEKDHTIVSAALTALLPFDDLRIAQSIISQLGQVPDEARLVAETLLASRQSWAVEFLLAVDSGRLKAADISESALFRMLLHDNSRIQTLVARHWGSIAGSSADEVRQQAAALISTIEAGSGNPKKGKQLFMQQCGKCHRLFDEGGSVGPDLTAFKRDDLQRVIINIVNPSAEIREGFENHMLLTTDGRVVNGFIADQDTQVVVLRGVEGQNLIFRRDEIDELRAIPRSVMPEGTLKDLSEQQLRDLFAYFRASQPVNY